MLQLKMEVRHTEINQKHISFLVKRKHNYSYEKLELSLNILMSSVAAYSDTALMHIIINTLLQLYCTVKV